MNYIFFCRLDVAIHAEPFDKMTRFIDLCLKKYSFDYFYYH